ncbi:chemotaxis protein CheW [Rhizobium skierniewicense]|uniref:chemotaxis protein CheW n=1 Tax=Rhizobium skierniewicense TaxID=984260 RepID=UPI003D6E2642
MVGSRHSASGTSEMLEIIAFRLHDQEFRVRTTTIREIRGWGPATPIPHAPKEVIGVMNLRGMVIPIIDLANKLGMRSTDPSERSAIVVAEVFDMAMGLVVDRVSDILTIPASLHPCIPASLHPCIPASLHPCIPAPAGSGDRHVCGHAIR